MHEEVKLPVALYLDFHLLLQMSVQRHDIYLERKGYSFVQYTVFDQLKQRLLSGQLSKRTGTESSPEALSAFSAFVLGAVSKCIASCLTYPAIRWIVNSPSLPLQRIIYY